MTTEPQSVRIAWGSPYKAPTVQLASGQLIADAKRVAVDCVPGAAPKVYLEFEPDAVQEMQLEGVVIVEREVPADPFKAVQEFLSNLDPGELDKAVLEYMAVPGAETFGQAALEVLGRWARGD